MSAVEFIAAAGGEQIGRAVLDVVAWIVLIAASSACLFVAAALFSRYVLRPGRRPVPPSMPLDPDDVIGAMAEDMARGCEWCEPPRPGRVSDPGDCSYLVRCSGISWCAGTQPVRIMRDGGRG